MSTENVPPLHEALYKFIVFMELENTIIFSCLFSMFLCAVLLSISSYILDLSSILFLVPDSLHEYISSFSLSVDKRNNFLHDEERKVEKCIAEIRLKDNNIGKQSSEQSRSCTEAVQCSNHSYKVELIFFFISCQLKVFHNVVRCTCTVVALLLFVGERMFMMMTTPLTFRSLHSPIKCFTTLFQCIETVPACD